MNLAVLSFGRGRSEVCLSKASREETLKEWLSASFELSPREYSLTSLWISDLASRIALHKRTQERTSRNFESSYSRQSFSFISLSAIYRWLLELVERRILQHECNVDNRFFKHFMALRTSFNWYLTTIMFVYFAYLIFYCLVEMDLVYK